MPDDPILDAGLIVGLLADGNRRRVVAALVLGASTIEEVRTAAGLDTRQAVTALGRLIVAELVIRDDNGAHFIIEEAFRVAAIAAAPADDREHEHAGSPPDAARVLRAFVRDGRLTAIPSHHGKRLVILDMLAQQFEPGRRYSEREVNAVIGRWHEDTAALRRYLVDDGFLDRDAGQYWRAGGSFFVDPGAT
jgi:hypothetical protein